jgi:hypothetical protein
LRDIASFGGFTKVTMFIDCDEILKLGETSHVVGLLR